MPAVSISRTSEYVDEIIPEIRRILDHMNCSTVGFPLSELVYGVMDANGSYDKHTGMLQRDEVDMTSVVYRTDMFPIPIAHLSSHGIPADVIITSKKNDSYRIKYQLMQLWASRLDPIIIHYFVLSWLYFLIVLSTFECIKISSLTMRWHRLFQNVKANVSRCAAAVIHQQNLSAKSIASRILVYSFNLFILFGLHGIIFGSMGADMVAVIDPPIINSMNEFTNTSYMQPSVIRLSIVYELAMKSIPGSELYPVRQAIDKDPDESVIPIYYDTNMAEIVSLFKQALVKMDASKKAILYDDASWRYLRSIACDFFEKQIRNCLQSKHNFASGMYTIAMSRKIDPRLRQVVNYLVATMTETGISQKTAEKIVSKGRSTYTDPLMPSKSCEPNVTISGGVINAFGYEVMQPFFQIYGYMILVSYAALLHEHRQEVCQTLSLLSTMIYHYLKIFILICTELSVHAIAKFLHLLQRCFRIC
jgi:hypothetical protein